MSKKTWTIMILTAVILLTSFAIYINYNKSNDIDYSNREQAIQDLIERPDVTVNVKHQYRDGEHVYLGTFKTPTPCHSYNSEILSELNQKIISLTYSNSEEEICSQVITERDFRVSFFGEESESENVIAKINGVLINLNIFEVPQSQNIEDFQIFIKG